MKESISLSVQLLFATGYAANVGHPGAKRYLPCGGKKDFFPCGPTPTPTRLGRHPGAGPRLDLVHRDISPFNIYVHLDENGRETVCFRGLTDIF
jgi:hypothetical protein